MYVCVYVVGLKITTVRYCPELVEMQQKSPDAICNALIKENFSLTDVVKLNRAMKQLST